MNLKKYNVGVVGATGLIGGMFLKVLAEYNFPINELRLFASERSENIPIEFKDKTYYVKKLSKDSFNGLDFVFFSAGKSVSEEYAPYAKNAGAYVIDNSSAFRMHDECALIVPEININDYKEYSKIIANPNCSTIQAVLPLKALLDRFGLESVRYTTYQAVSGSGQKGVNDLCNTQKGLKPSFYPYDISQTCIPQIDDFSTDSYTKEEIKMINETRKILHLPNLLVSATCIRVPVKNSHGVVVMAELSEKFNMDEIFATLEQFPGIKVIDDPANKLYPLSTMANDNDLVYVGRIRKDLASKNGIIFYCVSDNTRKGAASNAIQIAQKIIMKEGNN